MKKKVLIFARSFFTKYFCDIQSDIIEPVFVTLTSKERVYLEEKGRKVYGCFEEEYDALPVASFPGGYLRTSLKSDRFLCRYNYEKRQEILGKEISFWRRVFNETKPDYLINETVAVEISEVMTIEAESAGIPVYTYLLGFLPNTFYWKPNPFNGRLQDMSSIIPSVQNKEDAEQYIKNVKEKGLRPFYVAGIKRDKNKIKALLSSYVYYKRSKRVYNNEVAGTHFKYEDYTIFSRINYEIKKASFINRYDSLEDLDNKNIVFLPMHLEPEATLNYFVEENYDQDSLISLIVGCIKSNQILVVKEHPQQQGMLMTRRFQELKKRFSNLAYLPSYVSSFDIIKKCEAVVTLTSSAAWEALMFEKPIFVLGGIFFDQCPGAIRVDNIKQLKRELNKENYVKPDIEKVELFAAKMISLFHKGCPSPLFKENTVDDFVRELERLA